jgi:LysM repeat protein
VTERGLPHADGATACPFVAFDDDRDERSSVPDHRHRCFAEPQPAPRALAHQEAYCLSSAFPVCPTFQDWARREAARSRDGGRAPAPATGARPVDRGSAEPPVIAPGLAAAAAAAEHDALGRASAAEPSPVAPAPVEPAAAAIVPPFAPPPPAAHADDAFDDEPGAYHVARPDDLAQRNPPRDWAAPPPWLASAEATRRDDAEPPSFLGRRAAEPGQGLAGSPADRMAGGSMPPGRDREDDEWTSSARSAPPPRTSGASRADRSDDDPDEDGREDDEDRPRSARRPRAYSQHLGGPDGPDWERPRRYEAYPTIRTRVSLPRVTGIPPIVAAAAVIAALALVLFFLPGILNFGGAGGPGASTAPSNSEGPSVSLAPTVPPQPTPELYTIKKNETLSKIASAHGITLDELLAANPSIKNPNKISEGQQIIIPVPSDAPPDTVGESPAPS